MCVVQGKRVQNFGTIYGSKLLKPCKFLLIKIKVDFLWIDLVFIALSKKIQSI